MSSKEPLPFCALCESEIKTFNDAEKCTDCCQLFHQKCEKFVKDIINCQCGENFKISLQMPQINENEEDDDNEDNNNNNHNHNNGQIQCPKCIHPYQLQEIAQNISCPVCKTTPFNTEQVTKKFFCSLQIRLMSDKKEKRQPTEKQQSNQLSSMEYFQQQDRLSRNQNQNEQQNQLEKENLKQEIQDQNQQQLQQQQQQNEEIKPQILLFQEQFKQQLETFKNNQQQQQSENNSSMSSTQQKIKNIKENLSKNNSQPSSNSQLTPNNYDQKLTQQQQNLENQKKTSDITPDLRNNNADILLEEPLCEPHSDLNKKKYRYKDNYCIDPYCKYSRPSCDRCFILAGSQHKDHQFSDYNQFQQDIKQKHEQIQQILKTQPEIVEVPNKIFDQSVSQFKNDLKQDYKDMFELQESILEKAKISVQECLQQLIEDFDNQIFALNKFKQDLYLENDEECSDFLQNLNSMTQQNKNTQKSNVKQIDESIQKFYSNTTAQLEDESLNFHDKVVDFYYTDIQEYCKTQNESELSNNLQVEQQQQENQFNIFQLKMTEKLKSVGYEIMSQIDSLYTYSQQKISHINSKMTQDLVNLPQYQQQQQQLDNSEPQQQYQYQQQQQQQQFQQSEFEKQQQQAQKQQQYQQQQAELNLSQKKRNNNMMSQSQTISNNSSGDKQQQQYYQQQNYLNSSNINLSNSKIPENLDNFVASSYKKQRSYSNSFLQQNSNSKLQNSSLLKIQQQQQQQQNSNINNKKSFDEEYQYLRQMSKSQFSPKNEIQVIKPSFLNTREQQQQLQLQQQNNSILNNSNQNRNQRKNSSYLLNPSQSQQNYEKQSEINNGNSLKNSGIYRKDNNNNSKQQLKTEGNYSIISSTQDLQDRIFDNALQQTVQNTNQQKSLSSTPQNSFLNKQSTTLNHKYSLSIVNKNNNKNLNKNDNNSVTQLIQQSHNIEQQQQKQSLQPSKSTYLSSNNNNQQSISKKYDVLDFETSPKQSLLSQQYLQQQQNYTILNNQPFISKKYSNQQSLVNNNKTFNINENIINNNSEIRTLKSSTNFDNFDLQQQESKKYKADPKKMNQVFQTFSKIAQGASEIKEQQFGICSKCGGAHNTSKCQQINSKEFDHKNIFSQANVQNRKGKLYF